MSGDVSGSILSKNVFHHSNQRGFVVHGTHNVDILYNVADEPSITETPNTGGTSSCETILIGNEPIGRNGKKTSLQSNNV
mmetsp:Transcript_27097/g.27472  ORF Transcript_27097/g.27472 Transcript_27097/m.27472 type:complete len:80 (-) Transcript_27097:932-1171(-)